MPLLQNTLPCFPFVSFISLYSKKIMLNFFGQINPPVLCHQFIRDIFSIMAYRPSTSIKDLSKATRSCSAILWLPCLPCYVISKILIIKTIAHLTFMKESLNYTALCLSLSRLPSSVGTPNKHAVAPL